MARSTFRRRAPLFAKKRSVWLRASSMLLLTLALGVTGFGIATAVYLEGPQTHAPADVAESSTALPMPAHDPLTAAAAVPHPAEVQPTPGTLPAIEPQAAPPVAAPPVQEAALEPPVAVSPPPAPAIAIAPSSPPAAEAPPAVEAEGAFWVEYGVFIGRASASRLQEALGQHGLAAVIVATHGQGHRKLLRVRSTPMADLAAAQDAAETARRALRLATLLHHDGAAAAPQFRVQFGTFTEPRQAARLRQELASNGIAATVSSVQRPGGKLLYSVKSTRVPDRTQALALGERGRLVAKTNFLIERAPSHDGAAHRTMHPPQRHATSLG